MAWRWQQGHVNFCTERKQFRIRSLSLRFRQEIVLLRSFIMETANKRISIMLIYRVYSFSFKIVHYCRRKQLTWSVHFTEQNAMKPGQLHSLRMLPTMKQTINRKRKERFKNCNKYWLNYKVSFVELSTQCKGF